MQNEPIDDVYPNRAAPVVVEQGGERRVREDMLWGFPPFKQGTGYGTNFRSLRNALWRDWLDRQHRGRASDGLGRARQEHQQAGCNGVGSSEPTEGFSSPGSGGPGQATEEREAPR